MLGEVKHSQRVLLHSSSMEQHHRTGQVADNFSDAGLVHNRTSVENLLCIEVFFRIWETHTATIRRLGIRAVAFDRSSSRTSGPIETLDLTKPDDLEFLRISSDQRRKT